MPKNRVLIIDDDQRICRIIKSVAENLGLISFATDNSSLCCKLGKRIQPEINQRGRS